MRGTFIEQKTRQGTVWSEMSRLRFKYSCFSSLILDTKKPRRKKCAHLSASWDAPARRSWCFCCRPRWTRSAPAWGRSGPANRPLCSLRPSWRPAGCSGPSHTLRLRPLRSSWSADGGGRAWTSTRGPWWWPSPERCCRTRWWRRRGLELRTAGDAIFTQRDDNLRW